MRCLNRRKTNLTQRCLLLRNRLNRLHDKNIKSVNGLNRRDIATLKHLTNLWNGAKHA